MFLTRIRPLIVLAVMVAGCAADTPRADQPAAVPPASDSGRVPVGESNDVAGERPRLVYQVTEVSALRGSPEELLVEASGQFSSSGWSGAQLRLVADPGQRRGPLVYELVATPPDGMAAQVITDFRDVRARWQGNTELVTEVRVSAAANACSARVGEKTRCGS